MVPVRHFDIFLSHAYKDKVIVAGIYHLLKASGFTVYVDWVHDRSRIDRSKVTADNAAILRERMRQCSALFFVTTDNYKDSRWMPWECGYFDGYDGKLISGRIQAGHVAILPVLESPTETFKGVEYLGLYPVAQKGNLTRRNINIHNQKIPSRSIHFDPWVKNGHP
ncbi:MAG: toll-Interleukin receptor [gamma proteobacterium symbiont of Ctena orbiculata]|nr:MAG: toll-Interleukin receptor [gamma proteobacterium symbiont of Ctena orbiculata]